MLTWNLDRLVRSATLCLVLAVLVTGAMGFFVESQSDVDSVLGGMLVGAVVVGVGGVIGSIVTSGAGVLLFGVVAALAQPGAGTLLGAGCVLLIALVLIDLSITIRRAPLIDRGIWLDGAIAALVPCAIGAALFALAWFIATLATWQTIVLPFGVIALGYAMRFAADALTRRTGA